MREAPATSASTTSEARAGANPRNTQNPRDTRITQNTRNAREAAFGASSRAAQIDDAANGAHAERAAPDDAVALGLQRLALDAVRPGRSQPRTRMGDEALAGLAASIKTSGMIQPIAVRALGAQERAGAGADIGADNAAYEIVAGERRWRAARMAGLTSVPAIVVELDEREAAEWAIVENVQREDLNAIDKAHAYRRLSSEFRMTHGAIAERLGVDRSSVANLVRLTELPEPVQEMVATNALTTGHAKALLAAPTTALRETLAHKALADGWTVRRLEDVCARAARGEDVLREIDGPGAAARAPTGDDAQRAARDAAVRDLEKQLSDHLGTRVRLRTDASGRKGSVVIEFYDLDHFEGLMGKMGFRGR